MTDREKLLVALLSENDDAHSDALSSVEVVTMLEELGREHRRGRGDTARIPA